MTMLRERSLTIGGGRAGKFWGRAVFFLGAHLGWAIILWAHVL